MKYNLKNRPRPENVTDYEDYYMATEQYLQCMEKELRELIKDEIVGRNMESNYVDGRLDQIKEILGEA